MDLDVLWKTTDASDVAAHVSFSRRARQLTMALGVVRAAGNVNRFIAADARARSAQPTAELAAALRRAAPVRHHPPGTRPQDPLVDVLLHTQAGAATLS